MLSESADVTLESLSRQAGWDDENFVEGSRLRSEGQVTVAAAKPCAVSTCDDPMYTFILEPQLPLCCFHKALGRNGCPALLLKCTGCIVLLLKCTA